MELKLRKSEVLKIDDVDEMALKAASLNQFLMNEIQKQQEEIFRIALRTMAEPPIKGEITKGKIKWRGIRLIRQEFGFNSYSWIEQRGRQISPKIHIKAILPELNIF